MKKPTEFYVSGPCKRGHVGPYYVSGRNCVECTIRRSRKWRAENPEENLARVYAWQAANPEVVREIRRKASAAYYYRNRESITAGIQAARTANPEPFRAAERKRRAKRRAAA
jgi:hypothetical protein